MPGQCRLGDKSNIPACVHGCPACPHPAVGPALIGSMDVNVNKMPAIRVDDTGMHTACCNTNMWTAKIGSGTVYINGKAAHRMGVQAQPWGGFGQRTEAPTNVIVGG